MYIFKKKKKIVCKAPALEQQQTMQPVGYQLVQDQSGQYFLLPQNSIAG